ncbi:MAG: VWA domain-containing protein [Desulfobacterales bacterium]|nr:VWA domain-containing protein [Desulfobacterales bacterium]
MSKSMLAEDAAFPVTAKKRFAVLNRMNSTRYFALRIISHLNGEQIGLYVFAEKSTEIIPMTNDYGYCRYIIRHVNESSMTVPGSDMSEAVKAGTEILKQTKRTGAKILILISDGEDTGSDESLDNACQKAADKGIVIYTVGIGSHAKVMIPVRSPDGRFVTGYYKDEEGIYLKTRQVERTLKQIANITGGQYLQADKEVLAKKLIEQVAEKAGNIKGTKQSEISRLSLSLFFLLTGFFFFISGFIYYP